MTRTIAPLRISFAGGGTDIEPYCIEYGGAVMSAAVRMYAHAEYPAHNFEPNRLENIVASLGKNSQVSISQDSPPMSGLGGSASCFVAGIKAVRPELRQKQIAELAIYLERTVLGNLGGKQDQYVASYGGMNYITFGADGVSVNGVVIPDGLEDLLYLVYMGDRKLNGADVIKDQMSRDNVQNFNTQKRIASDMRIALETKNLRGFGHLMQEAWLSKVQFSPYISTPKIDGFISDCFRNGATACKLTGAGGGGYLLIMADPDCPSVLEDYLNSSSIPYKDVHFEQEGVRCL